MREQKHRGQDDGAEGIDMFQRIERDPAQLPGSVVAQPVRDKAVRGLMEGDGDDAAAARFAGVDRVGCFAYSPVEGASANDLPGAVPDAVKEERRARLMALQASISESKLKAKLKRKVEVLIDAPGVGRSKADAPEIDGVVHFEGGKSGEFGEVWIDRADEHDLYGRLQ